jgi:hypothetical protein
MLSCFSRKCVLAAIAAACLMGSRAQGGFIDTTAAWAADGSIGNIGYWGGTVTPTYGQTFTATSSNSVLQTALFEINVTQGAPINYNAYVFAWNGYATTGSALATLTGQSVSGSSYKPTTANFGAVTLTPGQMYVVLFSTVGLTASSGYAVWGGNLPDNTYSDGTFVFNNNSTTTATFDNAANWYSGAVGDAAFTFTFGPTAAIPEPSSLVLMTVGLIAIGGGALRRRRDNQGVVITTIQTG